MKTYRIARIEELVEDLKSHDVSRLNRADIGYTEFCEAIDDYNADGSSEHWWAVLRSIAAMFENAMENDYREL